MALGHRIKLVLGASAAAALFAATPAAAQHFSDGYKFLQAVEKGDVNTVKDLIAKNSTIIDSREAELSFYGQVFGFEPADIPRLELWRP